jgi:thioredoxin reductase (NADPH)
MVDVSVIGGGPAGMSAALFTGKNGLDTAVFDTDETWMHKAHLFNYPGLGSVAGSTLIETLRNQVDTFGVERHQGTEVTAVETQGDGFGVRTEDDEYAADYVVLGRPVPPVTSPRALAVRSLTRMSST